MKNYQGIRNRVFIIMGLIVPLLGYGQGAYLDQYIKEGVANNLALKQKEQNYEKSLQALNEARALFYPDISLNARYTVAEGGRLIEFPVGDLLNPVYSTLNMLTGTPSFPQIENESFRFYRPAEHETKASLVQPLFDTRIFYNRKIRKDLAFAQKADADTYRRLLIAEIKSAYFNYLKTLRLKDLVDDTRDLLEENLRVNQSLFDNDKVTIDNVYRSRAELSQLDQQAAGVEKSRRTAIAYFNFLLNRPLETEIMVDGEFDTSFVQLDLEAATSNALSNREELTMLEMYASAAGKSVSMNRSQMLPSVYGAVDYGFQGEEYSFTGEDDFVLASVVLKWDLFHGFENRAKVSQARVDQQIRETRLEEVKQQISMEVVSAWYELEASRQSITSARSELNSAQKAFGMVSKKFGEGQTNLIEFIDARTTMTNANASLIIAQYDYHIKFAELERIAGLYDTSRLTSSIQ